MNDSEVSTSKVLEEELSLWGQTNSNAGADILK